MDARDDDGGRSRLTDFTPSVVIFACRAKITTEEEKRHAAAGENGLLRRSMAVQGATFMEHHGYGFSITTPLSYTAAVEAVTAALKTEGFGVLTTIDVQATLKQKLGAEMPSYTILGACNPPLAHRALRAEPEIGLLLPCNVIVYTTATGQTTISAIDPEAQFALVQRADLAELAQEVSARLRRALAHVPVVESSSTQRA
jgi:uncharacterized protein (DUF302 family)